jgi:glycerate-2-kinase
MARPLEQARKIGKSDLVVGIPFFDEVGTIPGVIQTITEGIRKYYPDKKVVIITVGDRRNGIEAKKTADRVEIKGKNIHRMSLLNLEELSGKGWCMRIVLELAQQLGAPALFLDASLGSITDSGGKRLGLQPETIKSLYQPLLQGFDYITPYYINHQWDGTITNHLCYPLMTVIYGKRIRQPIGGEIALSNKFVHILLRDPEVWFTDIGTYGVDNWITSEAIVHEMKLGLGQSFLTTKIRYSSEDKHSKLFKQVASILFDQIIKNSPWWISRSTDQIRKDQRVELFNAINEVYPPPVSFDWSVQIERFKDILLEKEQDYKTIFSLEVNQSLKRISEIAQEDFLFPESLWVEVVYDFLLEYAFCDPLVKEEFTKDEMLDSLIPIYLARAASFAKQTQNLETLEAERLIAHQADEFIQKREGFMARWQIKANEYRKAYSQLHYLINHGGNRFARLIREEIDEAGRKILYLAPVEEGKDRNTFLGEAKRYARILSEIEGREVVINDNGEGGQKITTVPLTRPCLELSHSPFEEDYLVITKELAASHLALKALYLSPDTRVVQITRADITSLPWIEFDERLIEQIKKDIINRAIRKNLQAISPLYFEEKVKKITDLIHKSIAQRFSKYAAYPRLCAEATLIAYEVFIKLGYFVDSMWTRDLHYFLRVSHGDTELIVDLTSDQFSLNRFSFLALEIEVITSLFREGKGQEISKEKTLGLIEEIAQIDFTGRSLPERDSLMITLQKLKEAAAKAGCVLGVKLDQILARLLEVQLIQQIKEKRNSLEDIYRAAIVRVDPYVAMRRALDFERPEEMGGILRVGNRDYDLSRIENIFVVGAGNEALMMARALVDTLGESITRGVLCVPEKKTMGPKRMRKFKLFSTGYPISNPKVLEGSCEIKSLLQNAGKADMVITLISDYASDLMCYPCDGLAFEHIQNTKSLLKAASANITEIYSVLKHLEALKGGKMRILASDVRSFITLAISDEPSLGDEPAIIAGGPTVGDESTFSDALEVLNKYSLLDKVSGEVRDFLQKGAAGLVPENPRLDDPLFSFEKSEYLLVADNDAALDHACHRAEKLGYRSQVINKKMIGEVHHVAKEISFLVNERRYPVFPQAIIIGGKPTVNMNGISPGKGGRMSMLATILAGSLAEEKLDNVTILAADTDGIDGNSDIAGGVVDSRIIQKAESLGLRYRDFLKDFDSATLLKKLGWELRVGKTGTDVGDLVVVLIHPKRD